MPSVHAGPRMDWFPHGMLAAIGAVECMLEVTQDMRGAERAARDYTAGPTVVLRFDASEGRR